jgi:hypothetical protein
VRAGAAKAEVARKSAALKSVSVRLRPRADPSPITSGHFPAGIYGRAIFEGENKEHCKMAPVTLLAAVLLNGLKRDRQCIAYWVVHGARPTSTDARVSTPGMTV